MEGSRLTNKCAEGHPGRRTTEAASGLILCRAEHAAEIDRAGFPGQQGGPLMHVIAAKAVAGARQLAELLIAA